MHTQPSSQAICKAVFPWASLALILIWCSTKSLTKALFDLRAALWRAVYCKKLSI